MKSIIYITEQAKFDSMFDLLSDAWSVAGTLEDRDFGKEIQESIQEVRAKITAYELEEMKQ